MHFQTRTYLLSTSILKVALQYALTLVVRGLSQRLISTFLAVDDRQLLIPRQTTISLTHAKSCHSLCCRHRQ